MEHRKRKKNHGGLGCGSCYASQRGRGQKISALYAGKEKWDGVDQSAVDAKKCSTCSEVKPLEQYAELGGGLFGRRASCQQCRTLIRVCACGATRVVLRNAAKLTAKYKCQACVDRRRAAAGASRLEELYARYRNKGGAEMIDVNALIGQEFGALTVMGEGPRLKAVKYRSLHCKCRCGNETDQVLYEVTRGEARTCGCKYDFSVIEQESIIGKRYGKLLVLSIGPVEFSKSHRVRKTALLQSKSRRYRTMLCRCDCGVEKNVNFNSLLTGNTRSCGCGQRKGQDGVPHGKRRCSQCHEVKDQSFFNSKKVRELVVFSSHCHSCARIYQVWSMARAKYGMSKEDVLALGAKQDWNCAICSTPMQSREEAPLGRGFNSVIPQIDHEHVEKPTKEHVRGLLCGKCNSGLAFFKDNKESLTKAIAYLQAYEARKTATS